jgi:hypothetical protein
LELVRNQAMDSIDNNIRSTALDIWTGRWPKDPETFKLIKDRAVNDNDDEIKLNSVMFLSKIYPKDPKTLVLWYKLQRGSQICF